MAHPLHLALYSWLPLGVAFNLEIISSYLFLFAGAYLLWRALNLSIEGAIVGAMLAAFSGFTLYNLMHVNHIATLAHAPWLLLACHGVIAGKRPAASFALAALVTGSQLLTGNPQYVWITLVVTLCFCAWQWSRAAGGRAVAALAIAALLGGLIGSIQLLPSIEFFGDSARAIWTPEQALTFSLSPLNLVQLWTPFAFRFRVFAPGEDSIVHEFIVYNGALCTIAFSWIALRWHAITQRRLVVALLLLAALGLWLAFGRYGGIYPLLARLPVLSGFRAPSRHIVLFQFALAGLAGIAFEYGPADQDRHASRTPPSLADCRSRGPRDRHDRARRSVVRNVVGRGARHGLFAGDAVGRIVASPGCSGDAVRPRRYRPIVGVATDHRGRGDRPGRVGVLVRLSMGTGAIGRGVDAPGAGSRGRATRRRHSTRAGWARPSGPSCAGCA